MPFSQDVLSVFICIKCLRVVNGVKMFDIQTMIQKIKAYSSHVREKKLIKHPEINEEPFVDHIKIN